jgi:D-alanyl-D-alanine dipeptidase
MATKVKGVSIVEPISETDKIKVKDNGEQLLSLKENCPKLILKDEPDSAGEPRAFFLRESLIEMLNSATKRLPRRHKFVIWSCYRTLEYQTFIYNMVLDIHKKEHPEWPLNILRRETNRFVHPPHTKTPPGHCTGGAVDLTIAGPDGLEIDMSAPYGSEREEMRHVAATYDPKLSNKSRENRQMLIEAMKATKLTNYAGEWWHWSYGDSCWAWRVGRKTAIYGVAEPTKEILKVLNQKAT